MFVRRTGGIVNGASGVCDDRGLGDAYGVDADALVPAGSADDISFERETIDSGGSTQQVGDTRRVVLSVIACERRQERAQPARLFARQISEARVVARVPSQM